MFWLQELGLKENQGGASWEALGGKESVSSWFRQLVHLPGLRDTLPLSPPGTKICISHLVCIKQALATHVC